jgi:hypothetical protein
MQVPGSGAVRGRAPMPGSGRRQERRDAGARIGRGRDAGAAGWGQRWDRRRVRVAMTPATTRNAVLLMSQRRRCVVMPTGTGVATAGGW